MWLRVAVRFIIIIIVVEFTFWKAIISSAFRMGGTQAAKIFANRPHLELLSQIMLSKMLPNGILSLEFILYEFVNYIIQNSVYIRQWTL